MNFLAFCQQLVADIVISDSLSMKSTVGRDGGRPHWRGGGQDALCTSPQATPDISTFWVQN